MRVMGKIGETGCGFLLCRLIRKDKLCNQGYLEVVYVCLCFARC